MELAGQMKFPAAPEGGKTAVEEYVRFKKTKNLGIGRAEYEATIALRTINENVNLSKSTETSSNCLLH